MAALAGLQIGIKHSADQTHEGAAFLGDLGLVAIDVHQPVVDHGREARVFGNKAVNRRTFDCLEGYEVNMRITRKPLDDIAAASILCIERQATFNGGAIVFDGALPSPDRRRVLHVAL